MRNLATILIARAIAFAAAVYVYAAHRRQVKRFRRLLKRWPRPGFPRRYNDRVLWRKVFDRDPRFTRISDKLGAKEFVHERVGGKVKTPRTLWVGRRPEDIPAELLTGDVVVKPNHSFDVLTLVRGGVVDREKLNADARGWLEREHHVRTGEWAYTGIDRKLFVEEMMLVDGEPVAEEYKFLVFGGQARFVHVLVDRWKTGKRSVYTDRDGVSLGPIGHYPFPARQWTLHADFERARELAEAICADFDFLRCDMYFVGRDIYVGELTVYPGAGWVELKSERVMAEMGAAWDIRRSWFVSQPRSGLLGLYAWAIRVIASQTESAPEAASQTATAARHSA